MRNNYSAADHDPGDEDPSECVKRALLELIEVGDLLDVGSRPAADAIRERLGQIVEVPPRHAMSQTRVTPLLDVPFASSPWPWLV